MATHKNCLRCVGSLLLALMSTECALATNGGQYDVVDLQEVEVDPENNSTGACSASDVNCNDITVSMILENQFNDAPNQLAYISTTPSSFEDGSQYIGEWLGDQKHGTGMYTSPDGLRYVGSWENGMRVGWSIQTYTEGKYVGDFKDDLRQGMGTFHFENGDQFYGQWDQDRRTGPGILTLASGDKYMGKWSEDGSTGFGAFVPAGQALDSTPHEGKDKNGRKRGQGICVYEDGSYFIGEWYSDPKGSKAAIAVESAREELRKTSNSVDGDCHWDQPTNGGSFGAIMFHGTGFKAMGNGDTYVGDFEPTKGLAYSEMHGQGQMAYSDGSKYIGEFNHNERSGEGIFTHAGGGQSIGTWAADHMLE